MTTAASILTSSEKFIIKLGLERVSKILEFLGNPQAGLKVIHVAGTNGKGSVCAMLSSILTASGQRTGHFSSPHLFSYCERIRIDEVNICENSLDALVNFVCECAKKCEVELTEFEILTVAAFYYFARERVDIVVLETGLGGRLDATNVVKTPLVSIITSISHDHTQRLGESIEKIAFEKAGVIKKEAPVIVSGKNKGYEVISERAKKLKTGIILSEECQPVNGGVIWDDKEYEFAILGGHQIENLGLALSAAKLLNIPENAIREGLKKVRHKFRLEYIKEKNLLIDGCHNSDGARVLREFLDENYKGASVKFIFGCLNNKDYYNILKTLVRKADELCFYEFNNENALKFEELPQEFQACARKISNPNEEMDGQKLSVVCGSLYMLGEIFKPE